MAHKNPENYTRLNVWLPKRLHRAAKIKAAQTDISMSAVCRLGLEYWLETGQMPEPEGVVDDDGRRA